MKYLAKSLQLGAAVALLASLPLTAQAQAVDPKLPDYKPVSGVSGNLKSIGSDSLNNLMTLWAEGFRGRYPNVQIEIEGKGSGTAPPALIAGTAQFGPMSRPMKGAEMDEFAKKYGNQFEVPKLLRDMAAKGESFYGNYHPAKAA